MLKLGAVKLLLSKDEFKNQRKDVMSGVDELLKV